MNVFGITGNGGAGRREIAWRPASERPDADMTVLCRMESDAYPLLVGFWDGNDNWRQADVRAKAFDDRVIGWMQLEDAAALLDKGGSV